ncbi:SAM-dependent methyltransferase [Nocardioides ginsengisegetis]|uniref:SAM-dependent methyltransferase n=1 Tax=Nocardioides ginsengisegetis TaxID=661491 RepID=A0A7W3P8X1_9ACTN|nr:class I SAM-dependent methyltransferase [Nocardioides ginsengisegetis]MBA8803085.1 SAM-dependent methyltransferase [Nocardioides ginsengisegetis]
MRSAYSLAYRLGITPWQRAGAVERLGLTAILDREQAERDGRLGRALDIGCGSGLHTMELSRRGWDAVGIDEARPAVDRAMRREGPETRFVIGDVAYLPGTGIGQDFDLYLDIGCFEGLTGARRRALGRGVTQLANPGAAILICTRPRGAGLLRRRGADLAAVEDAFPGWQIRQIDPQEAGAHAARSPGAPQWFRLEWPAQAAA